MAKGAIRIRVRADNTQTKLQRKLETLLNDGETKKGINRQILRFINEYVPYRANGESDHTHLRDSVRINEKSISWNTPYARYQYFGEVYGPNFLVMIDDEPKWRSPKGKPKYPTGRSIQYHTPGTSGEWDKVAWQNDRRRINYAITMYLKRRARDLDL